jgi:hypothetical protein
MLYKLDLHRLNYEDATSSVIRFIEDHWDDGSELEIITGNSDKMKAIVLDVLNDYKLSYTIGREFDLNKGYVVTWT